MNPTQLYQYITEENQPTTLGQSVPPKKDYFIIGSYTAATNSFSVSQTPTQHSTETAAKKEAERLSKSYSNKKFIVLKIVGMVQTTVTIWE